MQPIVNYEGYIPGRTPTPEMLYCSGTSTPQYILDNEREEALQREREETLLKEREDERKKLEYEKIREEIRRTEIEQIRRTEMEKLREELRKTETELQKKRPRGRAPVGKQWNVKQGVWESESESE